MEQELRIRTKAFALRIIRLFRSIPAAADAQIVAKQLLRSGTSVGAHYREAYRARSTAEYVAKVEVALQELEETTYWIELLIDGELVAREKLQDLLNEADELMAILVTCVKTAKANKRV